MSSSKLYRAMLKTAKQFDAAPWRRAFLSRHPELAGRADSHQQAGLTAYFFEATSDAASTHTTQNIVRAQFRRDAASNANVHQALTRGFEALRAMKSAYEAGTGNVDTSLRASHTNPLRDTTSSISFVPTPHACGVRRAATHSATPPPAATSRSSASLAARSSSSTNGANAVTHSHSSGPALRPKPHVPHAASESFIGRLHPGAVDLQKPRTPPPAEEEPTDLHRDSQYEESVMQASAYAEEYLKLVTSSGVSRPAADAASREAAKGDADPDAGNELFLIDASRMRHQESRWYREVAARLTREQQVDLESLVQTLGQAVEAHAVDRVLDFQLHLATMEHARIAPLMSNNRVVDAWIAFLYASNEYAALVRLMHLRLACGVPGRHGEYGLSRPSLCRVIAACAIEGDAATSLMVLRETSWATIANPEEADHPTTQEQHFGLPSSAHRLPSWVPMHYSTPDDVTATTASTSQPTFESEDAPDDMLASAGDGFGADVSHVASTTTTSSSKPEVSHARPRLSVNVHARPLLSSRTAASPLSSLASLLGSSLLHSPHTPSASAIASHAMSTRARPRRAHMRQQRQDALDQAEEVAAVAAAAVAAAPREAVSPVTPPTPLPVIDLWMELSMDAPLMELAVLAAVRQESRDAELRARAAAARVEARAAAHPLAKDAALNLSMHEHAEAIFGAKPARKPSTKNTTRTVEVVEDPKQFTFGEADTDGVEREPTSVFGRIHASGSSPAPLAFQLWSLMLRQQVPLNHSHTYVQLMRELRASAAAGRQEDASRSRSSPSQVSLLLDVLTRDFHAARSTPLLHRRFLRTDMERFMVDELALHQRLANEPSAAAADASFDHQDHAWYCIDVLRSMHAERVAPPVRLLARLYRSLLFAGGENGFGRASLLQDLLVLVEDFADIDPRITAEDVINQAVESETI